MSCRGEEKEMLEKSRGMDELTNLVCPVEERRRICWRRAGGIDELTYPRPVGGEEKEMLEKSRV